MKLTKQHKALYDKLIARAVQDQDAYIEQLKTLPPEQIVAKAYEITCRDNILLTMQTSDYTVPQLQALLKIELPVDSLYQEWLSSSFTGTEELRGVMDDFTNGLVKAARESAGKDAPQAERRHTEPTR